MLKTPRLPIHFTFLILNENARIEILSYFIIPILCNKNMTIVINVDFKKRKRENCLLNLEIF